MAEKPQGRSGAALEPSRDHRADGSFAPGNGYAFPKGVSGNPGGAPRGASIRAALLRGLARDPDDDGIGAGAADVAERAIEELRNGDEFNAHLYARVSEQVDGKPSQSVQHSGEIRLVPMILPEMPADMLEEGDDGDD